MGAPHRLTRQANRRDVRFCRLALKGVRPTTAAVPGCVATARQRLRNLLGVSWPWAQVTFLRGLFTALHEPLCCARHRRGPGDAVRGLVAITVACSLLLTACTDSPPKAT